MNGRTATWNLSVELIVWCFQPDDMYMQRSCVTNFIEIQTHCLNSGNSCHQTERNQNKVPMDKLEEEENRLELWLLITRYPNCFSRFKLLFVTL